MLVFGYQARMRLVDQALPYCQHIDEHTWTQIAIRILKTGDLNPHRFTKPSVMVYLNTATFALGLLKSGMRGEVLPALDVLREGGYPYYTSTTMIRTAQQAYAMLSVLAIAFSALIARKMVTELESRRVADPVALPIRGLAWISLPDLVGLLTIGIALVSTTYLRYSHWYLGVDLLGCVFAMATIAYLVLHPAGTKAWVFALLAGVLSGLCLGTKYNLYPIASPVFLTILFRYRSAWLSSTLLFIASMVSTFLVTTPYALFDLPAFLWSAAGEAHHYATGHGRFSRSGGIATFLAYGQQAWQSYGLALVAAALSGIFLSVRGAPKLAAIILSYPLCLWLYMSGQRTFFPRNLLVLQLIVPVFASLGIVGLFALFVRSLRAKRPKWPSLRAQGSVAAALLLSVCLTVSWPSLLEAYQGPVESRNVAAAWLDSRPEATVLVARELEMDVRRLRRTKKVVEFHARDQKLASLQKEFPGALALIPVFDKKEARIKVPQSVRLRTWGRSAVTSEKRGSSRIKQGNPRIIAARL